MQCATHSTKKRHLPTSTRLHKLRNTKLNNPALFWLLCTALFCHSLLKSWVLISRLCLLWQGESLLKSNLPASLYVACFAHVSFCWHMKSYLFFFLTLACDQHVSPYSSNISWRGGAMSGEDATLTEGKRKWIHSSPTRSWKEMGNSEGKHWSAFRYISADGGLCGCLSLQQPHLTFQTLPLWHWLQTALAAATVASCEQMGGKEQANMSCLMVYCKKYEDALWHA